MWGVHLDHVLYGLFFLFLAVGLFAHRSLVKNAKRYDVPTWEALGCPEPKMADQNLRGLNSMRDEFRLSWGILSMKYRGSAMKEVRRAGDVAFGCTIGLCITGVCLLTFARWG